MESVDEVWRDSFDREGAINWAKWVIDTRYAALAEGCLDAPSGSEDSLHLVSDSHDRETGRWTISLRDAQGASYKVVLGVLDGFPVTQMIERVSPPEDASDDI
ncbi:hypothetical protein Sme01_07290 [Sphaerisporangium melleum]|nr:hypothetical protein Sme01_07290 [Sphaerisporangium melleum]